MPLVTQPRPGEGRQVARARGHRVGVDSLSPEGWMAVALTVAAGLLRFSTLTSQSFWLDEATTVHEVGLSFGGMLSAIAAHESTPPLYFMLAWIWTRLFGAGEFGLRSLSSVAGTALIPVSYLCGRELVSRRAGLAAAALATFSPFLIWYSQEARAYMLFGLLGALSLLFWARYLRTGAVADAVIWAICSGLALLTHFYAGFVIAPEALWMLWHQRTRLSAIAVAAVAAVQLALVPLVVEDTSHPLLSWLQQFPLYVRLEQIPVDFGASQLYRSTALSWGLPGAALLLAIVLVLIAFGGERSERAGAARAGAVAAFALLVPVLLAELGHDYVFSRNFIVAWVPLSVVVGAACTTSRLRVPGAAVLVALLAGFIWATAKIDGDPAYQRPDWRAVASALGKPAAPRAIVTYAGNVAEQPLAIYLPQSTFSYSGIPSSPASVSVAEVIVLADPIDAVSRAPLRGARLISTRIVAGVLIVSFRVSPEWRGSPAVLAARAGALLPSHPRLGPAILIQR